MARRVLSLGVFTCLLVLAGAAVAQDAIPCVPECTDRECGDDGCGTSCGECTATQQCVSGVCQELCVPDCTGKECGSDGCEGQCGTCDPVASCIDFVCVVACQADCVGKECGDDGCGTPCGTCADGFGCEADVCVSTCQPNCEQKECGEDGCGGSCGTCGASQACWGGLCGPDPAVCGDGFCQSAAGEQCDNCAADCDCATNYICQPTGVCVLDPLYDLGCTQHDTKGCSGCTCEPCVCLLDPYCCNTKWDARCVEECTTCGTGCIPPGICGNGICEPAYGEQCSSCTADCACLEGEKCSGGVCVPDVADSEGCTSHYYAGCSGCDCEDCVCSMDYYCCNTQWDSTCVSECKQCGTTCGGTVEPAQCGNWWCQPDQGENCGTCPYDCYCNYFEVCEDDQCVVNGVNEGCWETYDAGCDNCACEECVCSIMPSCCEPGVEYYGGWDWNCVNYCQTQCGGCGPPVVCGDGTCVTQENCASCPADCACKSGDVCLDEVCCHPQCDGKNCGSDGCGGSCGICEVGVCDDGVCAMGLGCDVHEGPGCLNCACQACVCEISPSCCTGDWDEGCASYCALDCGGCEQIPSCGDGICAAALGENCASCQKDCGCQGHEYCKNDTCVVDFCSLGLGSAGCCSANVLHLCMNGSPEAVDCTLQEWVCGWYPGDEDLAARYYCGPEGQVSVEGDPTGTFPMACPECTPSCDSNECGHDGCGGSCGTCESGTVCKKGICEPCTLDCTGKECGHDGCGGACGMCGSGQQCQSGTCVDVCFPDCAGKTCGPDGCGGVCGECSSTMECYNGKCTVCVPNCQDKACGSDGCGGSCGICPMGWGCKNGECTQDVCTPNCLGKQCGDDGCGDSCGTCPEGKNCEQNQCVLPCTPNCQERTCGPDGCGGTCGECDKGMVCTSGNCTTPCVPSCQGRECGDNGCGGRCGTCADGRFCNAAGACQAYDQDASDQTSADTTADLINPDPPKPTPLGGGCSAGTRNSEGLLLLGFALFVLFRLRKALRPNCS